MKIRIRVRQTNTTSGEWTEDYDKVGIGDNGNIQQAEDWAAQLIDNFNATLRPGECARTLLGVELIGNSTAHQWYKRTDGMSARVRGRIVDVFECSKCGVTGKKFGLTSTIKRDSRYRAKKYATCT